ncbi:MAG: DUF4252 domain-containing protein [Muribaculaceae bacterium]|nr:DUF4252 domain-containing protein [Muribaculaceae bacterium]
MEKKICNLIIAFIFISICIPLNACAQSRILADLPSGNGVEKLYINKALVNMGVQNKKETFNYEGMTGDIQGIEMYSCENASLTPSIKIKIDEILKQYNAVVMIESEENGETSEIYNLYDKKEKGKSIGMAIIESGDTKIDIVIIHGATIQ